MPERGSYPFTPDIQDKTDVKEGAFAIVKEFANNPDWIVKEFDQVLDEDFKVWLYMQERNPTATAPDMTFERFQNEVLRHKRILDADTHLTPFIPESSLVYGTDSVGKEKGFIVMRKVTGEDLENVAVLDSEQQAQLESLINACFDFYEENRKLSAHGETTFGYFLDIIQSPLRDDDTYCLHNIMYGTLPGESEEQKRMLLVDSYPLYGVYGGDKDNFFELLSDALDTFEHEHGIRFSESLRERIKNTNNMGYAHKESDLVVLREG